MIKEKINLQFFADPQGDPQGDPTPPAGDLTIPKHRFDEVSKKVKDYEAQVAELNTKLESLTEKENRIAALEQEIKDIKDGHTKAQLLEKKTAVIKNKIDDKVVDFEMVLSLLNLEEIEVNEEGKVKGLSKQVEELKKSKPYLWKPATKVVEPGAKNPPQGKSFAQQLAERRKAQLSQVDKSKNYF